MAVGLARSHVVIAVLKRPPRSLVAPFCFKVQRLSIHWHYPASSVLCASPTPGRAGTPGTVEGCDPSPFRASHVTQPTFPACRSHYPGEVRWVPSTIASPTHGGLPRISGGSALTTALSRPAQDSLTLRPTRLQARLKADLCPLGFSKTGNSRYPSPLPG